MSFNCDAMPAREIHLASIGRGGGEGLNKWCNHMCPESPKTQTEKAKKLHSPTDCSLNSENVGSLNQALGA